MINYPILSSKPFDDAIALDRYPIDSHIPLRALIVKDFSDLFVCGRRLSATHEAISLIGRNCHASVRTGYWYAPPEHSFYMGSSPVV